jgi:hypothetical protein
MIMGVIIARKRYPLTKYFYVLLIVLGKSDLPSIEICMYDLGVILFMYKEPAGTTAAVQGDTTFGIGELSLVRFFD